MEDLEQLIGFDDESNNLLWKGSVSQLQELLSVLFDDHVQDGEIAEDPRHSSVTLKLSDYSVRFYTKTETMKIFGDKATTVRDTLKKIFESSGQKVLEASSSPPLLNAADKNEEKASPTAGKSSDDHNIQQQLTYIKEELSFMKSKLFTDTTKSCEGEEVKRLTDELEYLKDEVKEYKRTIRNLQQERENLICALNIVVEEQNHNRSSESRVPKSYDQGTSTIPQGSKQHDNDNEHTNKDDEQPWSEVRPRRRNRNPNRNKDNSTPNSKTEKTTAGGNKRPSTVVMGDSVISRLEGWRMSDKQSKVVIRSFSGAKVDDFHHHSIPTLETKPSRIILHVGTNNVKDENPSDVAEKIVKLCEFIEQKSPKTKIAVLELTPRNDSKKASIASEEINKILRSFSRSRDWQMIPHPDMNLSSLNSRGIHLNTRGTSLLARDFKSYINQY